jgi:hypothetical protein
MWTGSGDWRDFGYWQAEQKTNFSRGAEDTENQEFSSLYYYSSIFFARRDDFMPLKS